MLSQRKERQRGGESVYTYYKDIINPALGLSYQLVGFKSNTLNTRRPQGHQRTTARPRLHWTAKQSHFTSQRVLQITNAQMHAMNEAPKRAYSRASLKLEASIPNPTLCMHTLDHFCAIATRVRAAIYLKAAGDKLLMKTFIRQNYGGGLTLKNFIS